MEGEAQTGIGAAVVATNMVACSNTGCGVVEIPDNAKFCPQCGKPLGSAAVMSPSESQRRTVTIVYCDIHHSTTLSGKLELEALRDRLDRFAQTAREVFGRHGGRTGIRQGDSMMGVFGIPVVSDDDALRAVRAASDLRGALVPLGEELEQEFGLGFAVRIGVNTGQALVRLVGDAIEEQVEGPEVALARRLEENAEPGEILIGEETYELVRDAIHTTKELKLKLNGFPQPETAWRLGEVLRGRPGRIPHLTAPLVGRQHELTLLADVFQWVAAERSRYLVTLLGEAGVGKTRLADDFVRRLGDRVTALRGHCLSYGEEVTFWPVKQIVYQAVGIADTPSGDSPGADSSAASSEQLAELSKGLTELLSGDERDREALTTIKQLLGIGGEESASPADTPMAVRRLFENLARRKPLVALIDDLHLADERLLETIEQVAAAGREAPIMLICMARPDELSDKRPTWPRGWMNNSSLVLSPLKPQEGEELIGHLLPAMQLDDEELAHLIRLAQGNPLTVEELVAMFVGKGWLRQYEGRWIATPDVYRMEAPPGVNVILQARLDKLELEERKILERAAVVGEQFHAIDVEALSLASDPVQVAARLDALERHQIIQQDQTAGAGVTAKGSEGYRFRHILMRQAVYDRMTKPTRAGLHERYADWLEAAAGDRISEIDELIASHLYEAYNYLRRQGKLDERAVLLGQRAGEYFAAAGRRAAKRGDVQITATLLGRTTRLLPPGHPTRLEALPDLAEALQAGGELERAIGVYEEIKQASTSDDDRASINAALGLLHARAFCDLESFLRSGLQEVEALLPKLERNNRQDQEATSEQRDDCRALAKATYLLAYLDWAMGRNEAAGVKAERACGLARQAGDERLEASIVRLQCVILYWGPTPIAEVERYNKEALELAKRTGQGNLEAGALTIAARIAAMHGEFERARRLSKAAERINTDLGELLTGAMDTLTEGVIGLLSNDLSAAEQALRRGFDALERMGGAGPKANVAAWLARVLLRQERLDEAEQMTRHCEVCAATHQADAQARWRSIRAVILARRQDVAEAERLIKEALERADETDQPDTQAEVRADYAEVLRMAGRRQEAAKELKKAKDLYEEKGNLAAAKQMSTVLVTLR